jgi:hypothetical protein
MRTRGPLSASPPNRHPPPYSAASRVSQRYLYLLTGIRGETVTDVSQRLLAHHGGLRGLFRLDVAELADRRGTWLGRLLVAASS